MPWPCSYELAEGGTSGLERNSWGRQVPISFSEHPPSGPHPAGPVFASCLQMCDKARELGTETRGLGHEEGCEAEPGVSVRSKCTAAASSTGGPHICWSWSWFPCGGNHEHPARRLTGSLLVSERSHPPWQEEGRCACAA